MKTDVGYLLLVIIVMIFIWCVFMVLSNCGFSFKDKRQRFEYKGNYYRGVKNCLRKDIIKDVWIESIIYESERNKKIYVRDLEDFNNKFKEVK